MKNPIFVLLFMLLIPSRFVAQNPYRTLISEVSDIPMFSDSTITTSQLTDLVNEAASLLESKGEETFTEFRKKGSKWNQGEQYIFVLDPAGIMWVHPDPELEGKNQLNLADIHGKPIIRGLIAAAYSMPGKTEGWYHYQWPVPGGLFPRWKSSFVKLVKAPSGKFYILGCGVYNDRMERPFVVDAVNNAVAQIRQNKEVAFQLFRDPASQFMVKDAYIFVIDPNGIDLVNPGFPNLEGRNLMDLKDAKGKYLVREMFEMVRKNGYGWVDYMWPKPGEHVSTLKSTYVTKVNTGDQWFLVGCGAYLADAPKSEVALSKMSAHEMTVLVKEAASVFENKGENAFPEFRKKGSKWYKNDNYFFVWSMDGMRIFHAADPQSEGMNVKDLKDIQSRPIGKMILDVGKSNAGEGWIHYMYPEPGDIFPTWKSTFVKRVKFPSGEDYIIGCGIYNMKMDQTFIEDLVNRAGNMVSEKGIDAFGTLRNKTGPFVFMQTYVFVQTPQGIELVNGAMPSLEGKSLIGLKDLRGREVIQEQIQLALKEGSGWLDCYWYLPGDNKSALKKTYVKKVQFGGETYIVGSGLYP